MSYEQQHRQQWDASSDQAAKDVLRAIDQIFHEYLFVRTYEREGTCLSVNTSERTARVALIAVQDAGAVTVTARWGLPALGAATVGRVLRVWERVESRLEEDGPVIVARDYIVDTPLRAST